MKPTGSTANTPDCFRTFIGQQMKGYFHVDGDSYLVFDDGRALVLHHATGAYWVIFPAAVEHALYPARAELKRQTEALADMLQVADGPSQEQG